MSELWIQRTSVCQAVAVNVAKCVSVLVAALLATAVVLPVDSAVAASAASVVCTPHDSRLNNVSGLVSLSDGYAVINDRGSNEPSVRVYLLNRDCRVTRVLEAPGQKPVDIEDLARTPDDTLWLADTGDNDANRENVTVWAMDPATGATVAYRLSYPDGPRDVEALLMGEDRVPVLVTKNPTGNASVYLASQPLVGEPVAVIPLRPAGSVRFTPTRTQGGEPGGDLGRANVLVTGGTVDYRARRAALRTYTDGYEWTLPDDAAGERIADAVVDSKPRRTPLPGESQGESLAYSSDGRTFLTLSEGVGKPVHKWVPLERKSDRSSAETGGFWTSKTAFILVIAVVVVLSTCFTILWARRRR